MNTKPQYYYPLRKKLLISVSLIIKFILNVALIWSIMFVSLFIKSLKGCETPFIFCNIVSIINEWDYMWKENPPKCHN
jgi:uncharacterized protein with PQ loop repeat